MLPQMKNALALCFLLACADSEPPTWGSGAALEASAVETTTLTLSWGDAGDESLAGYELLRDGEVIESFGTEVHEHQVAGLADATTYAFSIVAKDSSDNRSEPLHVEVTTLDGTPPSFPANARVVAVPNEDGTRVSLSWPEAVDNVAVERYEVHRDGEPAGQIQTSAMELEGGPDGLTVFAVDARGNASQPIGSSGDATARAEVTATQEAGDTHPDMAPVRIELSPAVQRAVGRTQGAMLERGLQVTPNLKLRR